MTFEELQSNIEDIIIETVSLNKKDVGLLVDLLTTFIISDLGIETTEDEEDCEESHEL